MMIFHGEVMIMKVTEERAKITWCPFVRLHEGSMANGAASINRIDDNTNCLGHMCMAWIPDHSDTGYCGLVPQPQA